MHNTPAWSRAPRPDDPPALLVDAREAARRLAISSRTLWTLTRRGELPAVRIGRSVRYSVADLAAYVERSRVVPATPAAAGPAGQGGAA